MSAPLMRRLSALERAVGADRVVCRAYSTRAEAEAASDPPESVALVRIITGVPRCPAGGAP